MILLLGVALAKAEGGPESVEGVAQATRFFKEPVTFLVESWVQRHAQPVGMYG